MLDLDGVVRLGDRAIAGASDAVARLRAAGRPVAFVTNNSSQTAGEVGTQLAALGIPGAAGAVITSAHAAATLVHAGERVLVCGGRGVVDAVRAAGASVVAAGPADAVVVGFHREFDYERLSVAAAAVLAGARLLATNDDANYPTPEGLRPGAGALVAAVARASGDPPVVIAGKGHRPMVDLVRARCGATGVVVGDRPDTDGRFAREIGYRFALVLSGVTTEDDLPVVPPPDLVVADLRAAVEAGLSAGW